MAKINDYSSAAAQPNENINAETPAAMPETQSQKPLARNNFIVMIAAGVMIVLGFLLMMGSSSTTEQFNEDIFSTRRLIVGPTIAFLGFIVMGVGLLIRPRFKK